MKRKVLVTIAAAVLLRLAVLAGGGAVLADWVRSAEDFLASSSAGTAEEEEGARETPEPVPSCVPDARFPDGVTAAERLLEEAVPLGEAAEVPSPAVAAAPDPPRCHDSSGLGIDVQALLAEPWSLSLGADGPQVLILHTHSSEAYTSDGYDVYEPSDPYRTEDKTQNVIRVGDALADALEESGLTVLHDREIYDYPSYAGSYSRSGAAVEQYLRDYPGIRIVIDLHRDAIGTGDAVYRTRSMLDGIPCAQLMLLVGTGANGLYHPNWRENARLALLLQQSAEERCPGLMRPLEFVAERYNQQLSPGSLILEVGSTGNTLQEAIRAAQHFGRAIGPVLAAAIN